MEYQTKSFTAFGKIAGASYDNTDVSLGFSIPAGSIITGVQVFFGDCANLSGDSVDTLLVYNGSQIGADKNYYGANWGYYSGSVILGGNGDLWSAALTVAIVNDASFGINVNTIQYSSEGSNDEVDNYGPNTITVYYTPLPGAFDLNTPANAATGRNLSGTLSWNASADADAYDVYFDTNNPPTTLVGYNQARAAYDYSGLTQGVTYHWKVVAKNAAGNTACNANFSFIAVPLPGAFVLSTPANAATGQPVTAGTLTWVASSNAATYDVYLDTANPPVNKISADQVGTSCTYATAYIGTVYYWKVVAKNNAGNTTCTAVFHFTTATSALPGSFSLTAPVNQALNQPIGGTLSWAAASGATGYDVYLDTVNPPVTKVSAAQAGTTYAYGGLTNGTTYYWKIVAKNGAGDTAANAIFSFTCVGIMVITTPWLSQDLAMLKFTQSADVITVTHPNYPPQQIERLSPTVWQIIPFANINGPFQDINADDSITVEASAVTGTITLTASKALFTADLVGLLFYIKQSPDDTTSAWEVNKSISAGGIVVYGNNYYQSTAGGTTGTVPPTVLVGSQRDGDPGVLWNYLHSGFGIVEITAFTSSTSVTATVQSRLPDLTLSIPTSQWALPAWGPTKQGYPATTAYFQDRQLFGGAPGAPSTLDMSRTDGFLDFGQGDPVLDDDAIRYKLLSSQVNIIRHMIELSYLVIFTAGGPWMVQGGGSNSNVITPSTINLASQGASPVSDLRPLKISNYALFLQEKGQQVRTLGYSFAENAFVGRDITVMSNHMLQFNQIVDWAYQETPYSCVWGCRDDGVLLGLTFLPEQQIEGWHRHTTLGKFENVCCVTENNKDTVYFIVKRVLNGQTVRCIERMKPRQFQDIRDAYFVDCGLTFDGRPTGTMATVFTGLNHLIGMVVSVIADGIVYPQQIVPSSGKVTIPHPASVVHIGLPYVSDFETLAVSAMRGNIREKMKATNSLSLIVDKSLGFEYGPDVDHLLPYKTRQLEDYDTPDSLISDLISDSITSSWGKNGRIFVRQSQPLPVSILAVIPQVETGGV